VTQQLLLPYQLSRFQGFPRDRGSSRVWLFYQSSWECCMFWDIYKLYPGQHDFLPAQSDLNRSLTARESVFFRSSDNIQGKQESEKFRTEDACCTRQANSWRTAFMAQGCRNSVAHFKTVGIAAFNDGTWLNTASRAFGIPKATLKRHISGTNK